MKKSQHYVLFHSLKNIYEDAIVLNEIPKKKKKYQLKNLYVNTIYLNFILIFVFVRTKNKINIMVVVHDE